MYTYTANSYIYAQKAYTKDQLREDLKTTKDAVRTW